MFILTWLAGLLRHRAARLAGSILGVALTVALLGSPGLFFSASKAQMTRQAMAGVVVDWQVQLARGADAASAGRAIAAAPGVVRSLPVGYASTTGLTATAGGSTQVTGPGKVLGLPAGYSAAFPGEIRYLVGAHAGVLLAQQTAANLHAGVGSVISIGRMGLPPVKAVVQGIVDLPAADSMFQAVGAPPGVSLQAPPDNVVLLPQASWQRDFTKLATSQPGAVYLQYHVALSPGLAPDPAAGFTDVTGRAKNLEVRLAGAGAVGDNLAAQLDAARKDALYAQLLFLFLGVPGAVLAALLTSIIAASGGDRRRREQALLRIRGASPRRIIWLAAAESLVVGVLGAAIGLVGAAVAGRLAFGVVSVGAKRLPGRAGARRRGHDLGELLHVPGTAAVLDRRSPVVLAAVQRGARSRPGSGRPSDQAARWRIVGSHRRVDVAPAPPAFAGPADHGPDSIVRGIHRHLQPDLCGAVPGRRPADQRLGRDPRNAGDRRGVRPVVVRHPGAAWRCRRPADDAQVRLCRE